MKILRIFLPHFQEPFLTEKNYNRQFKTFLKHHKKHDKLKYNKQKYINNKISKNHPHYKKTPSTEGNNFRTKSKQMFIMKPWVPFLYVNLLKMKIIFT